MVGLVGFARTAAVVAVGALVGLAAWALGPRAVLALLVGVGVSGGLLSVAWLRARQHEIHRELAGLRQDTATAADLEALAERLERRVDTELARRVDLAGWERRWGEDLDGLRAQLSSMDKRRASAGRRQVAQLQALQNLYAVVPVRDRMPPLADGWAVAPDFMLLLVSLVRQHRPATIVELGSGASTSWLALALRQHRIGSRLVTVEHDPAYAAVTREWLATTGVADLVDLRHAPLVDVELDGEVYPWYDRTAFSDIEACDLLVVDGPPGNLRPRSRYPALPLLADRLTATARIVVDDYGRDEERKMVAEWVSSLPGWTVRELPLEKGAALLAHAGQ